MFVVCLPGNKLAVSECQLRGKRLEGAEKNHGKVTLKGQVSIGKEIIVIKRPRSALFMYQTWVFCMPSYIEPHVVYVMLYECCCSVKERKEEGRLLDFSFSTNQCIHFPLTKKKQLETSFAKSIFWRSFHSFTMGLLLLLQMWGTCAAAVKIEKKRMEGIYISLKFVPPASLFIDTILPNYKIFG